MLETIVLFAAAEGEESSHTAFYVAGAALAAWAVLVSAIGIRGHRSFPPAKSARNGIMALSVLLVAATVATSILTA